MSGDYARHTLVRLFGRSGFVMARDKFIPQFGSVRTIMKCIKGRLIFLITPTTIRRGINMVIKILVVSKKFTFSS